MLFHVLIVGKNCHFLNPPTQSNDHIIFEWSLAVFYQKDKVNLKCISVNLFHFQHLPTQIFVHNHISDLRVFLTKFCTRCDSAVCLSLTLRITKKTFIFSTSYKIQALKILPLKKCTQIQLILA